MVLHALGKLRSQRLLFQQGNMLRAPQPSHVMGAQAGGHFTGLGGWNSVASLWQHMTTTLLKLEVCYIDC